MHVCVCVCGWATHSWQLGGESGDRVKGLHEDAVDGFVPGLGVHQLHGHPAPGALHHVRHAHLVPRQLVELLVHLVRVILLREPVQAAVDGLEEGGRRVGGGWEEGGKRECVTLQAL